MSNVDKFYTCSSCGEIKNERYSLQYLDDAKICHPCLDEKRFGQKRKECAERGFHITNGGHGNFIGRERDNVWKFESCPTCACGLSTRFVIDVPATPMPNEDGSPMFILGVPMTGYTMPQMPKRWFILEGKPTILPAEEVAV